MYNNRLETDQQIARRLQNQGNITLSVRQILLLSAQSQYRERRVGSNDHANSALGIMALILSPSVYESNEVWEPISDEASNTHPLPAGHQEEKNEMLSSNQAKLDSINKTRDKNNQIEAPEEFICPISLQLMDDPVRTRGNDKLASCDRICLLRCIKETNKHPLSNELTSKDDIVPDEGLKKEIKKFFLNLESKGEDKSLANQPIIRGDKEPHFLSKKQKSKAGRIAIGVLISSVVISCILIIGLGELDNGLNHFNVTGHTNASGYQIGGMTVLGIGILIATIFAYRWKTTRGQHKNTSATEERRASNLSGGQILLS
jgi:hypothetical protein